MAEIVTPSQLNKRSDFYHQLANLVGAGVPIITGLEHVLTNPPARSYVQPLRHIIADLNRGATFSEALESRPKWVPMFDLALMSAGERSGRLDQSLRLLSNFYKERAQMVGRAISGLLYPALLLHMAVAIFPTTMLARLVLQGDVGGYFGQKLAILLPLYAVIVFAVLASSGSRGESWRAFLEQLLRPVPFLGEARKCMSLARLSAALEALINAGISIVEAWPMAARASGSPALGREVARMRPRVDRGETPAEVIRESRYFPELFKSTYATGEMSGTLDQDLRRLHVLYSEEASRRYTALSEWFPKIMYLIIALTIAFFIISFYKNLFGQYNQLLE
jgi:type II secretory pathway component PulF